MAPLLLSVVLFSASPAAYRNARWAIRGLGGELLTNLAGRGGTTWSRTLRGRRAPPNGNGTIAVVSGATGGIGSEIAAGLAVSGYHVIVAARDRQRGELVVDSLRAAGGRADFVQYRADQPSSAASLASALRGRPCAVLVNNAGVMSTNKDTIMRTNYLGPALLTVALLPSLRAHPSPRVVNVGSSSHLRAARAEPATLENAALDRDLSAYAQSKLGLMQQSTLLRAALPWLEVVDAHPGIVWTPMLRRHWGQFAPTLERSRIARVLFKSPACGAATILAAALSPRTPPPSWGERARWRRGWATQPYFVNGRPGGFASAESRDLEAAREAWARMVEPVARHACADGHRMLADEMQAREL